MRAQRYWTGEEIARARAMRTAGMKTAAIAHALHRTEKSVRARLWREGAVSPTRARILAEQKENPSLANFGKGWNARELQIIADNPNVSPRDVVGLLAAEGFARTVGAVSKRRYLLGVTMDDPGRVLAQINGREASELQDGWPKLSKKHEARDDAFVSLVCREALRLGLVRQPERRAA